MNTIAWAMWMYWWRAAPWANGGHLSLNFKSCSVQEFNEINHLRNRKGGHLGGPARAAQETP
ncbi:MAG TPA: hypothetical protein VMS38_12675 [Pseudorhodoferax sp.]|nr:hypothetical protein [Pseudorhodoferax sp.]